MSIGLNKVDSSSQLIKILQLEGLEFHDLKVDSFLSSVWEACEGIWENVDKTIFTNHNLNHSRKIIKYFMDLHAIYHWAGYERLLFGAAALIHDIGMQYNKWAPPAGKFLKFPSPPLTTEEVRRNHVDIGFQLVEYQIDNEYDVPFPKKFCDIDSFGQRNALSRSAHIAFAHSGHKYLDILRDDPSTWRDRFMEEGEYRPRLLAGILRLCDELDGNFERVPKPERIYTWEINSVSMAHWLSCIFVEDTEFDIKQGDNLAEIKIRLRWQVPKKASDKQINLIRSFLTQMRCAKIANELQTIRGFFAACNESSRSDFRVLPIDEEYSKFSFPIKSEFDEVISRAISTRAILQKEEYEKVEKKETQELASAPSDLEPIPIIADLSARAESISVEESLRRWFNKNAEAGHYELINNREHTNMYVNCRTLVSDQNLLRAIAEKIFQSHKDHGIECVLAVGTSAIPIATNIAHRFRCSVTFTFSPHKVGAQIEQEANDLNRFEQARKQNYDLNEIVPSVKKGQTLLIIDDVISGGNVAVEVLELLKKVKSEPSIIFHHSIFRLGNREYKRDPRVTDYLSILHIPEVIYYQPYECPLCQNGEPLIKEAEMY